MNLRAVIIELDKKETKYGYKQTTRYFLYKKTVLRTLRSTLRLDSIMSTTWGACALDIFSSRVSNSNNDINFNKGFTCLFL